jgi:hypothetical protein
MRWTLLDVMEGRATATVSEITRSADDHVAVLAVDRDGDFGGVFRFGVYGEGEWYADGIQAWLRQDGQWVNLGEGGSRGADWTTPWSPPHGGWDGDDLYVLGTSGLDVEVGGEDRELRVVFGFAAPEVETLAVVGPEGRRSVPVTSPVGAFAVVLVGDGVFSVIAETGDGLPRSRREFKLSASA